MTPRNMARHRNSPHLAFWKNLKAGYDHFEVSHQQPKVDVCDRRYVYDAAAPDGSDKPLAFSPTGKCPVYQVQPEIADLMSERRQREGAEYASLVNQNIALADSRKGVDGGMNPVFMDKLNSGGDGLGATQVALKAPGALPREPNQPAAQVVPPAQPVQVASAEENAPVVAADVPVPRSAPQPKVGVAPQGETGIASLIDSIFGNKNETPAVAAQPAPQPPARPRTAVAAAKPAAKPTMQTASAPLPKQAPQTKVATASKAPGLRPSVKDEPRVAEAKPAQGAQPSSREPEMRTAFTSPPQPKSGLLSGAQPVVPAGTFESRWSAFRSF
jgi:hypothetical protein